MLASAPPPRRAAPLISVCIPAYNRPAELDELLESVARQNFADYEVVICEDQSPQRAEVRAVAERHGARAPGRVRYFENTENLGYDANFRELIRRARGEYVFIMGNDDLVAPGALAAVADLVRRTPGVGVVLRSLAYFRTRPEEAFTVARYYPEELLFPPGPDAVVQFYRRLVVMSGLVFHREEALRHETDRFDGLLFYQHHVASAILMHRPGLITPQVLAYYRMGNVPYFGASESERGKFTPGTLDAAASVRFIRAHLEIARQHGATHGTDVLPRVHRDMGRHMYTTFRQHAAEPRAAYWRLYRALWRLGFWRYPLFHAYALGVGLLGAARLEAVVHAARRRLGYTPSFGERPRTAVRAAAAPPNAPLEAADA